MTEDRVIGKGGKLPWHISDDLKRFKKITMDHPIIMGRKTFESIGHPLPGRHTIVLSRRPSYSIKGVTVFPSLDEVLKMFDHSDAKDHELFVIGGADVFKAALPLADKIYLTLVRHPFQGDRYFPEYKLERDFKIIEKTDHKCQENGGFGYSFITAVRG